jgi:3-deoxy-manno-octulosonate cytidylyltransferase (CMP-KDO synthetase)
MTEPGSSGSVIDRAIEVLIEDPAAPMATLATPIRDRAVYDNPACVKAVIGPNGRALYFSRSPVPHHRDGPPADGILGYLHLGLYVYRRDFLLRLTAKLPSPLEQAEKLEQLRVLEGGDPIAIGLVDEPSVGIDTPEDYRRFVERYHRRTRP